VNLDEFALPVKKLKGTDPVETVDLSDKELGVASAVVIASLICVNGTLTECNLQYNPCIGKKGEALIRKALQGKAGLFGLRFGF
jgi:hypothetical protein